MFELDLLFIIGGTLITLLLIPIVWDVSKAIEDNIKNNPHAKAAIICAATNQQEQENSDANSSGKC